MTKRLLAQQADVARGLLQRAQERDGRVVQDLRQRFDECYVASTVRAMLDLLEHGVFQISSAEICRRIGGLDASNLTHLRTPGKGSYGAFTLLRGLFEQELAKLSDVIRDPLRVVYTHHRYRYFCRLGIWEFHARMTIGERRRFSVGHLLTADEFLSLEAAVFDLHWYPQSPQAISSAADAECLSRYGAAALLFFLWSSESHGQS